MIDDAWIQTFTGRQVFPMAVTPDVIVIEDIAHALALKCRFTGHTSGFYSVAQHSVLVARHCPREDRLWALLHDASEAYLPDVASPLKRTASFAAFRLFEELALRSVAKRFDLPWPMPVSVKEADRRALATEARDLMAPLHPEWKQPVAPWDDRITPWSPSGAERAFLDEFVRFSRR